MEYDMDKDFDWFCANRDEIIKDHIGERVVIKDKKVLGYYATDRLAVDSMKGIAPMGTFIVQRCIEKEHDILYQQLGWYTV